MVLAFVQLGNTTMELLVVPVRPWNLGHLEGAPMHAHATWDTKAIPTTANVQDADMVKYVQAVYGRDRVQTVFLPTNQHVRRGIAPGLRACGRRGEPGIMPALFMIYLTASVCFRLLARIQVR